MLLLSNRIFGKRICMHSDRLPSNIMQSSLTSRPTQLLGLTLSKLHLLHMRSTLHTLPLLNSSQALRNKLSRLLHLHMRCILPHPSQLALCNNLNRLHHLHVKYRPHPPPRPSQQQLFQQKFEQAAFEMKATCPSPQSHWPQAN